VKTRRLQCKRAIPSSAYLNARPEQVGSLVILGANRVHWTSLLSWCFVVSCSGPRFENDWTMLARDSSDPQKHTSSAHIVASSHARLFNQIRMDHHLSDQHRNQNLQHYRTHLLGTWNKCTHTSPSNRQKYISKSLINTAVQPS
jgi:hypothetical protein